eukprot:882622-Amorphochlora_amoeboformis.AAC.1
MICCLDTGDRESIHGTKPFPPRNLPQFSTSSKEERHTAQCCAASNVPRDGHPKLSSDVAVCTYPRSSSASGIGISDGEAIVGSRSKQVPVISASGL